MSDRTSPAAPIDAATVILIRETSRGRMEVFLMRRHKKQSFMASAYVFPGGRLDEADLTPELSAYSDGLSGEDAARRLHEPALPPQTALGLHWTAIRETLEEAGLLLALSHSGNGLDSGSPGALERLGDYRRRIHNLDMRFQDMAAAESLKFDPTRLIPYSRWITPEVEKKRFDTRFFIMIAPEDQSPIHDAIEMTESLWIEPAEAVKKHYSKDIMLMPPTLITLEEMAEFTNPNDMTPSLENRDLRPILPQAFIRDNIIGLMLPADPEYSIANYKQDPKPEEKTRLYLIDERWKWARQSEPVDHL